MSALPDERMLRFDVAENGCWEWTGHRDRLGYGRINVKRPDGKRYQTNAHRWMYSELIEPVDPGLHVDHLCRNPPCVNPDHLEPVTPEENSLRGVGWGGVNARKTHCINGHEFTAENTYEWRGRRMCRTCRKDRRMTDLRPTHDTQAKRRSA